MQKEPVKIKEPTLRKKKLTDIFGEPILDNLLVLVLVQLPEDESVARSWQGLEVGKSSPPLAS